MNHIIKQAALILCISLAGEGIAALLPFSFPASIISMVLLLVLLFAHIIKESSIASVGDFFLKNMSLFFLPAAVGILEHAQLLKETLLPFILVCVLTLVATFGATAWTVQTVTRLQAKWTSQKNNQGGAPHVE